MHVAKGGPSHGERDSGPRCGFTEHLILRDASRRDAPQDEAGDASRRDAPQDELECVPASAVSRKRSISTSL